MINLKRNGMIKGFDFFHYMLENRDPKGSLCWFQSGTFVLNIQ